MCGISLAYFERGYKVVKKRALKGSFLYTLNDTIIEMCGSLLPIIVL